MKLQEALNKASNSVDRNDAELLLAFVLGVEKAFLHTHPEQPLSTMQSIRFSRLVKKRQLHAPVAYLTRKKAFYGRTFKVTPATLIPRPETELLVEEIVQSYKDHKHLNIIDIGTGSGAIAITLSLELPQSNVYASDISSRALKVARTNNKRLGADVVFTKSNLLASVSGEFDIIVANLPYLSSEDIDSSPTKEDLLFEPKLALIAPDDGLYLIKKLISEAEDKLSEHGSLYLELLPRQIPTLKNWLTEKAFEYSIQTIKDLDQKDRFIHLCKK